MLKKTKICINFEKDVLLIKYHDVQRRRAITTPQQCLRETEEVAQGGLGYSLRWKLLI